MAHEKIKKKRTIQPGLISQKKHQLFFFPIRDSTRKPTW